MKSKKWLWCMLLMCCFIVIGTKADAKSAKSKALEKYNSIMQGKNSYASFAVIYLDNDKIPELVVEGDGIYTYKSSKLVKNQISSPYYYWKKRSVIMVVTGGHVSNNGFGWTEYAYRKVNKSGYKNIAHKHEDIYIGSSGEIERNKRVIYYDGSLNTISKDAFDKIMLKYKKNTKGRKVKYYKNTSANRKKYLS